MPNKKITQLPPSATPLTGAEILPVVQSSATVQTTVSSVLGATPGSSLVVYAPAGAGAVATTVQTKLRESVSVKDFGAVGDGVTDDTAAVLVALTASVNKRLYFPSGTYVINDLNLSASFNNITIWGDGASTILKTPAASGAPALRLNGAYNFSFEDITFDGNQATQTLTTARTVRIGTGSYGVTMTRVKFQNNFYNAVFIDGTLGIARRVVFDNCEFLSTNNVNATLVQMTDVEDISFIGCRFYDWNYNAIGSTWFQAGDGGIRVIGCLFENTKSPLFAIETVGSGATKEYRQRNLTVTGNIFDGGNFASGGSGISGVSDNVTITGNVWRNSGQGTQRNGVESTGENWVISDNTFDNGSIVVASTTSAVTKNFTVTGNIVRNSAVNGSAILVGGSAATEILDVVISNNVVDLTGNTGPGFGIYLGTYGSPAVCKRVNAHGNTITKSDTASGTGIRVRTLAGSESIRVFRNKMYGTSLGIRTDDSATDVEIFENDVSGCPTPITQAHTTGVWRIYNNLFTGTMTLVSADRGDANVTIVAGTDSPTQIFSTPLTTNRTVTLSTLYVSAGLKFRVVRTAAATGASTLSVGGLKTLAVGQWADVEHNGTAWALMAFGSL